ncbi:MAG: hypothetical protein B6I26_07760 [Desulfobacteraceae bacterium 4572_130]|nr:MAG: hypothetical protein B6I26_07760 [Desulfobacteraceae bacterium 4572_130]
MHKLVIGNVPRGKDYFGQKVLIKNLWRKLEKDNILLTAPRRFGKTGAMYCLADNPQKFFEPVILNVEPITSPSNFIVELTAKLYKKSSFRKKIVSLWNKKKYFFSFLRDSISNIDIGGLKIELRKHTEIVQNWESYGEELLSLLSTNTPRLLLIIDEFPIMINHIAKNDIKEAEKLLRWFRSIRIASETQTRFVVGGSINLVSTLNKLNLVDTINDLFVQKVNVFSRKTAGQFIKETFANEIISGNQKFKISDELVDFILELVGAPIPYLLAVFLNAILEHQQENNIKKITKDNILKIFEEDLLSGATSITFQHYRSRIDQYYFDLDGDAAKSILNFLSQTSHSVKKETLYQIFLRKTNLSPDNKSYDNFSDLMARLENDFYLKEIKQKYSFFSRVLQLWWKNNYGYQEVY